MPSQESGIEESEDLRVSYENILFESENGIARITLNRPDRLNSFTTAMHGEAARCAGRGRATTPRRACCC